MHGKQVTYSSDILIEQKTNYRYIRFDIYPYAKWDHEISTVIIDREDIKRYGRIHVPVPLFMGGNFVGATRIYCNDGIDIYISAWGGVIEPFLKRLVYIN